MQLFSPIRKNNQNGTYERLLSFTLSVELTPGPVNSPVKSKNSYAENSVLSEGNWIKMSLVSTGIYRVQASELKKLDPGFSTADPHTIRVFGNGGGMIPEANATPRIDDLREISIQVVGEDDGVFDDNDYILFYGEGPDKWFFNRTDQLFHHQKNIYSDFSYYFVTYGNGMGKRVGVEHSVTQPATDFITTFNDFAFYEKDGINLIKSGRQWFDPEIFEMTTSRNYSFTFPDIDEATPVNILVSVAARSTSVPTSFSVYANGQADKLMSIGVSATTSYYLDPFAKRNSGNGSFLTSSPVVALNLIYNKVPDAIGYLDFIEINAKRHLNFSGNYLGFRSVSGAGHGKISEFSLYSPGKNPSVWCVTDPGNINQVETSVSGQQHCLPIAD